MKRIMVILLGMGKEHLQHHSIQKSNNWFSGRAIMREDKTLGAGHGQATTPKDAAS